MTNISFFSILFTFLQHKHWRKEQQPRYNNNNKQPHSFNSRTQIKAEKYQMMEKSHEKNNTHIIKIRIVKKNMKIPNSNQTKISVCAPECRWARDKQYEIFPHH